MACAGTWAGADTAGALPACEAGADFGTWVDTWLWLVLRIWPISRLRLVLGLRLITIRSVLGLRPVVKWRLWIIVGCRLELVFRSRP